MIARLNGAITVPIVSGRDDGEGRTEGKRWALLAGAALTAVLGLLLASMLTPVTLHVGSRWLRARTFENPAGLNWMKQRHLFPRSYRAIDGAGLTLGYLVSESIVPGAARVDDYRSCWVGFGRVCFSVEWFSSPLDVELVQSLRMDPQEEAR